MQDVIGVQVMHAKCNLNEELPDYILTQVLRLLLLQERVQVSVLAELHDDVDLCVVLHEGIVVLHDVGAVHYGHYVNFLQRLYRLAV